jgi:hypothetical protein
VFGGVHARIAKKSVMKYIAWLFVFLKSQSNINDVQYNSHVCSCLSSCKSINKVENFTEAHSMSSELLLQQCSVSTDEAQRRIELCCQVQAQRVQELTRDLDNIKSQQSRLKAKLDRIRKELGDRKVSSIGSPSKEMAVSSTADRNVLRKQVLLDEEESLSQQLVDVTDSVGAATKECASALEEVVNSIKSEIQQQLEGIIISYQEFLDSNNIKFNIWQRVIRKVRDDVEMIDIEQDLNFYRERVQYRYGHHLATLNNTEEDLGLPKKEQFCAIQNNVVDLERSNERDSLMQEDLQRPCSPTIGKPESSKVLHSIIGGIKAIGDIGINGGTQIIEGVSRGRLAGRKEDVKRRSRSASAGDGIKSSSVDQEQRDRDLGAVNDEYQGRRGVIERSSASDRSRSDGVAESDEGVDLSLDMQESGGRSSGHEEGVPESIHSATATDEERRETDLKDSPSRPKYTSVLEPGHDNHAPPRVLQSERLNSKALQVGKKAELAEDEDVVLAKDGMKEVPFKLPEPLRDVPVRVNPELVKFGIAGEKIIEHFSCALIPKRGLLTHGRMFITQHHIAFSGWPELRVLIPLEKVERLKKTNTVYIIPNAITVHTVSGDNYFFGSFIDRDACFELLSSMVNIAKSLVQVMGSDASSITATPAAVGNADVLVETNVVDTKASPLQEHSKEGSSSNGETKSKSLIFSFCSSFIIHNLIYLFVCVVFYRCLCTGVLSPPSPGSEQSSPKGGGEVALHSVSLSDVIDFDFLFEQSSITKLHDCQLDATSSDVWRVGWQKSTGYK